MAHEIPTQTPLLEWKAQQHLHHNRGTLWYVAATILVTLCVIYSIVTGAWSFLLVIAMTSALYWYTHREVPSEKHVRIWQDGIAVDNAFSEWRECIGYWIFRGQGYRELHIEKRRGAEIKIQTGSMDPSKIHSILSQHIPELPDRQEKLLDTIIRICKL